MQENAGNRHSCVPTATGVGHTNVNVNVFKFVSKLPELEPESEYMRTVFEDVWQLRAMNICPRTGFMICHRTGRRME